MIQEITIKNNWTDITIQDYFDIQNIENELDLFTILTNLETIDGIDMEDLLDIAANFSFIYTEPLVENLKIDSFTLNNKKYYTYLDLKKLKTIQFVDLQNYLKDPIVNLHKIIAIVCVPRNKKYNNDYDLDELSNEFLSHMNIVLAYSLFKKLEETLKNLHSTFSSVFDIEEEDKEEEEEEKQTEGFNKKWGWVYIGENVKNVIGQSLDYVWDMLIIEYMYYATYIKEKSKYDDDRIKKYKEQ